jgi:hypothetical protein
MDQIKLDSTLFSQPPPNTSKAGERINLQVVRSLKMHGKLAGTVAALVLAALVFMGLTQRPQFLAKSLVYVQSSTPKPITDVTSGVYDSARYDSYLEQQMQTIVRDDILADALSKVPAGMWRLPGESEASAVARLKASLKVERVLSSYEVSIELKGGNAQAVTRVVNEVTSAYLNKGRGDELAQSDQQLHLLEQERERISAELSKSRSEQAGLSTSLGVADTASTTTGNPYDVQLQELRTELATARQAHAVAEAQLTSATQGAASAEMLNAAADQVAASDPALAALRVSVAERRNALAAQMATMTKANPLFKQDEEEVARLDLSSATLSQSLRKKASQQLMANWRLEAARTGAVQARLEAQLADQTATATGATPKLQRASDLAADVARLQARFTEVDNAIHALELQQNSAGLVHLSLAATIPQAPATGRRQIILLAALPLALFCGAIAAVLAQKLDPRVYIAEDLASALNFPPMVVLPHPEDVDASLMQDYILRLVAAIDQAHRLGAAKTFVFTGASPGMETSGLVESLAKRMNEVGYKVLVTKASAALKSLEQSAQQETHKEAGLTLTSEAGTQLMRVNQESPITERLHQNARNVDVLFIDALPLLCSAETEFDTRLVDVTILLAESGRTTRHDLTRSLALIQRLTRAGVAAVLMDLRLRHADPEFLLTLDGRGVRT